MQTRGANPQQLPPEERARMHCQPTGQVLLVVHGSPQTASLQMASLCTVVTHKHEPSPVASQKNGSASAKQTWPPLGQVPPPLTWPAPTPRSLSLKVAATNGAAYASRTPV